MSQIVLQKLALAGFGPYKDRVELELQEGINNYVADNERGKSTLVMGVLAIIYGLPSSSNPSEFGRARFRNWDAPDHFYGELEFKTKDVVYKIYRNFDDNQVILSRLESSGFKEMFKGIHDPRGQDNGEYEGHLSKLFRIHSRNIFNATFCLTQPLPESRSIDQSIQALLTGGELHFTRVLEHLKAELEEYTAATGILGVSAHNQNRDRYLEHLETQIKDLEKSIEDSRTIVDSLETIQLRLDEIEQELETQREAYKKNMGDKNAWTQWRQLRTEYQGLWEQQKRLEASLEEARTLEETIKDNINLCTQEYPEFSQAKDDTEDQLDALISLRREEETVENSLTRAQEDLEALTQSLAEKKKALSAMPDWGELGSGQEAQVQRLQEAATPLLQDWDQFQSLKQEIEEIEETLTTKYKLFQTMTPQEEELVTQYSQRLNSLEKELEQAQSHLENLEGRLKSVEEEEKAFEEDYKHLQDLPEDAQELVDQKLKYLEKEKELEASIHNLEEEMTLSTGLRLSAGGVLGIIATAIGHFAGLQNPFGLLGLFIVLGLVGFFGAPQLYLKTKKDEEEQRDTHQEKLSGVRDKKSEITSTLGTHGQGGAAELGSLRQELMAREREEKRLEDLKASLPDNEELEIARSQEAKCQSALHSFLESTSKFRKAFDDMEEAYRHWKQLLEKKESLLKQREDFSQKHFNTSAHEVEDLSPLASEVKGDWRQLAKVLGIMEGEETVSSMKQLIETLQNCSDSWWQEALASSRNYEKTTQEIKDLESQKHNRVQTIKETEKNLLQLQEEDEKLAQPLNNILEKTGGNAEEARKRWNRYKNTVNHINRKEAELQTLYRQQGVASLDELDEKRQEVQKQTTLALKQWEDFVEKHPNLPKTTQETDPKRVDEALAELDEAIENVSTTIKNLETEEQHLLREQGRLQGKDPINIASGEIALKELQEEKNRGWRKAKALARAYNELRESIREFQKQYRTHLQKLATQYFSRLTSKENREINIRGDFTLSLKQEGKPVDIDQLSKGAQDQLFLSLRFAIADLLADDLKLPFIFDDPFVSFDGDRLRNLKNILREEATERQFLLLSHSEEFADWGHPLRPEKKISQL